MFFGGLSWRGENLSRDLSRGGGESEVVFTPLFFWYRKGIGVPWVWVGGVPANAGWRGDNFVRTLVFGPFPTLTSYEGLFRPRPQHMRRGDTDVDRPDNVTLLSAVGSRGSDRTIPFTGN